MFNEGQNKNNLRIHLLGSISQPKTDRYTLQPEEEMIGSRKICKCKMNKKEQSCEDNNDQSCFCNIELLIIPR